MLARWGDWNGTAHRPANVRVALAAALLVLALPAAAFAQAFFPTQSEGNRGTDVLALQLLLAHRGYAAAATGIFEATTEEAARRFQQDQGLSPDGVVGPQTWPRLVVTLRRGDAGDAVRALQEALNAKHGAGLQATGAFDAATEAAVRAFQGHAGIGVDGIIGPVTWANLLWHSEPARLGAQACGYSLAAERWGTSAAVAQADAAARAFALLGHGKVAYGDFSLEHGGDIPGHVSHEVGLDADLRPVRLDGQQCSAGCRWDLPCYDRAGTLALAALLRAHAPGHVRVVWFNDPVLIGLGLAQPLANHDDHLHIRWCEAFHPDARYAC